LRPALGQGEQPPGPMALQIPPHFAGQPLVTPELNAYAHRRDVQVHVWTINEEAEMERLLAMHELVEDVVGAQRRGGVDVEGARAFRGAGLGQHRDQLAAGGGQVQAREEPPVDHEVAGRQGRPQPVGAPAVP